MAAGETKTRSAVTWPAVGCVGADAGTHARGGGCGGALAETPACLPAYNCGGQLGAFLLALSPSGWAPRPFPQGAGQCGVRRRPGPPAHPPEMGKVVIPGYTRMCFSWAKSSFCGWSYLMFPVCI